MPSYNQAGYLREAVESCLAQSDPDWELWILDNSSDESPEVMRGFSDPRIHFIHDPARMDPGTCLNRLLKLAQGDCFSYVHTDNRLGSRYVEELHHVLKGRQRTLAYCDHWVIDAQGRRIALERRPTWDLGNLLGGHGLGVPFAATRDLAEVVGGFSSEDLADDVRFSDLAWGQGAWIHLREPLMDYRVHPQSRTEQGGSSSVLQAILRAHARALPGLQARGLDPLSAMGQRLAELLRQLDLAAAEVWLRKLGPWPAWAGQEPALAPLWERGLIRLPNFGASRGGPSSLPRSLDWFNQKLRLLPLQERVNQLYVEFRSVLLGWAYLQLGEAQKGPVDLQLAAPTLGTLWGGRILERDLGWSIRLAPDQAWPSWCRWTAGDARAQLRLEADGAAELCSQILAQDGVNP